MPFFYSHKLKTVPATRRVSIFFLFNQSAGQVISTRRFSNHESRLLSRAHTLAIIVILDLKIHQSMWLHWSFFPKNLNQRSLTPTWPLTQCLLKSHVWLYPRIIVSKSHDNTSMYVDTVINLANYHIHTYYIHPYILHTTYCVQNEWSHSLLLNSVQARQKRSAGPDVRFISIPQSKNFTLLPLQNFHLHENYKISNNLAKFENWGAYSSMI